MIDIHAHKMNKKYINAHQL